MCLQGTDSPRLSRVALDCRPSSRAFATMLRWSPLCCCCCCCCCSSPSAKRTSDFRLLPHLGRQSLARLAIPSVVVPQDERSACLRPRLAARQSETAVVVGRSENRPRLPDKSIDERTVLEDRAPRAARRDDRKDSSEDGGGGSRSLSPAAATTRATGARFWWERSRLRSLLPLDRSNPERASSARVDEPPLPLLPAATPRRLPERFQWERTGWSPRESMSSPIEASSREDPRKLSERRPLFLESAPESARTVVAHGEESLVSERSRLRSVVLDARLSNQEVSSLSLLANRRPERRRDSRPVLAERPFSRAATMKGFDMAGDREKDPHVVRTCRSSLSLSLWL
mmetsp:Transcript_20531/g.42901  ORF Transcript_20531/g.42901 Transcript_20531/m.42901 type:complete len:343 (-) Transcript_20531:422-1450(-)